jgi:hypothetical protein
LRQAINLMRELTGAHEEAYGRAILKGVQSRLARDVAAGAVQTTRGLKWPLVKA